MSKTNITFKNNEDQGSTEGGLGDAIALGALFFGGIYHFSKAAKGPDEIPPMHLNGRGDAEGGTIHGALPAPGPQGHQGGHPGGDGGKGGSFHRCHAIDCTRSVPPRFLMCPQHWGEVPRWAQSLIWRFYRPGQEEDKRPSPQYLVAQCLVVSYHAKARGILSAEDCAELLEATVKTAGMPAFEEVKAVVLELGGEG